MIASHVNYRVGSVTSRAVSSTELGFGWSSTAWGRSVWELWSSKPERHVTSIVDLSETEAAELGPLLRLTSSVASQIVDADQVYNCLWSHAGGVPVHIHYVVQPVTKSQMSDFGAYGPHMQVQMFARGDQPKPADVERIAELARVRFATT